MKMANLMRMSKGGLTQPPSAPRMPKPAIALVNALVDSNGDVKPRWGKEVTLLEHSGATITLPEELRTGMPGMVLFTNYSVEDGRLRLGGGACTYEFTQRKLGSNTCNMSNNHAIFFFDCPRADGSTVAVAFAVMHWTPREYTADRELFPNRPYRALTKKPDRGSDRTTYRMYYRPGCEPSEGKARGEDLTYARVEEPDGENKVRYAYVYTPCGMFGHEMGVRCFGLVEDTGMRVPEYVWNQNTESYRDGLLYVVCSFGTRDLGGRND